MWVYTHIYTYIYIYIYMCIHTHPVVCLCANCELLQRTADHTFMCARCKFKSETPPPKHTGALSKLNMIYKKENNLPLTPKASILIKLF